MKRTRKVVKIKQTRKTTKRVKVTEEFTSKTTAKSKIYKSSERNRKVGMVARMGAKYG